MLAVLEVEECKAGFSNRGLTFHVPYFLTYKLVKYPSGYNCPSSYQWNFYDSTFIRHRWVAIFIYEVKLVLGQVWNWFKLRVYSNLYFTHDWFKDQRQDRGSSQIVDTVQWINFSGLDNFDVYFTYFIYVIGWPKLRFWSREHHISFVLIPDIPKIWNWLGHLEVSVTWTLDFLYIYCFDICLNWLWILIVGLVHPFHTPPPPLSIT